MAERYTKKQFQLVQRFDGPIQPDLNYGLGLFYLSANAQWLFHVMAIDSRLWAPHATGWNEEGK